jgi:gluconokinase
MDTQLMHARSLQDASGPLILAIDIGSSSVRTQLYDRDGRPIAGSETQLEHELSTTTDGGSFADPDALFDLLCSSLDRTVRFAGSRATEIAAVGTSVFWHSLLGLNRNADPCTPVYMWGDKRAVDQASLIRNDTALAARMLRETGCRPHSSYWPAKLKWLRQADPDQFNATSFWVSFSDYVSYQLTGELLTSISMASGTGLFSTDTCGWHESLVREFAVRPNQLSPLIDRRDALPPLLPAFRLRWPALASATWFPPIGDGAAANVGAGCVGDNRLALTIGTSAAMRIILEDRDDHPEWPQPLWVYRLDAGHRVIGGALSNGGNVMSWLADILAGGDIESISKEAESVKPDGHGLTSLPYFAGERSPTWNDDAFASLLGLRFASTRADIFRAALEGTAYRLAAIYDDLATITAPEHEIHANGGAALNSPLWMQIIADTLDHRLDALETDSEASARGAAVCALEAIGIWASLVPAASEFARSFQPDRDRGSIYRKARVRQVKYEEAINRVSDAGPASGMRK